jgi:uncharacterized Zn finger protein (UPF0148 family)
MTFCGQCGTEIAEKDGFCTNCGRKAAAKKEQQTEQSVNNWTDLYQSTKKLSKKKPRKKVAKKEKEEKLTEYEKDYLKRLKKKPRKKAVKKEVIEGKIIDIKKPQKQVSSLVLPSTSFSFSGSRLPTFLIAGFVLGFITFAIIGLSSSSDPYGCTQCDVFAPGYDGPPPIEMDLWVPDDYYYDDYYDGGYYP